MDYNPLIVALDVSDRDNAMRLVDKLADVVGFFKIGSELFTSEGPEIVREIIKSGAKVFLDLKFHDIPATVSKAVSAATRLGVDMLTIHASGGLQMMIAAEISALTTAAQINRTPPLVLGVTVLTSMADNDLSEIGIDAKPEHQVLRLARLAVKCGLRGLVCSPLELQLLRSELPSDIKIVTPGIRSAEDSKNDQKRTMTAREAICAGANYIVVGRPICSAEDPRSAAKKILDSMD
ncbi:MAG: orotidine-5'-phosphate decarboxylase [Limisphaerales bacterium]